MKLDVSDLFDHFYEVTTLARSRFELTADPYDATWSALLDQLTETLLVPACANRAYTLTHIQMPFHEVKPRLITPLSLDGQTTLYCRYVRPYFRRRPWFFSTPRIDTLDRALVCKRPEHRLILWLGKLPPAQQDFKWTDYPPRLDLPIRYFAQQSITFHDAAPCTTYLELHGHWRFRTIRQQDARFIRRQAGGQFHQFFSDHIEISPEVFETMWAASQEDPAQE